MGRLISLAVLSVAVVVVGVFAAGAGNAARSQYTLAQAYYAGIITRDDLAGYGCSPAGFDAITCVPTDIPWCPEHPTNLPRFDRRVFTPLVLWGRLPKRLLALPLPPTECEVSPYDLGIITGVHIVGPIVPRPPYLR